MPGGVFFVAAEASGDLLAREVVEAIRQYRPQLDVRGVGGAELASVGIQSAIDLTPLSVFGIFEGIKVYGEAIRLADATTDAILAADPKVVVLVDSWGFMLRVAQRVRARAPHIRIVKLIGPQVWATRPGRAGTLAATIDHLLCMHDIEVPYYEPFGLRTTVIGNPALSRGGKGNRVEFRTRHGISEQDKAILILPGSRRSEIERVAPALMSAAKQVKQNISSVHMFVEPAENAMEAFEASFPDARKDFTVLQDPERRFDAMAGVDVVLACSGTVTSEVAMQGTPMVVAYKTSWITWALGRGFLYKKTHITLLNILNDDSAIVPEFVQTRQKPELIAGTVAGWLHDPEALETQRAAQARALSRLQNDKAPAAQIAAEAILSELDGYQRSAIGL